MYRGKIFFPLLVLVLLLILYRESFAVPTLSKLHTMSQPNGITFKAIGWGDENIDGVDTEDGYSIVFDKAINRWTYAVYGDDGSLVSSSKVVGIDSPPDIPLKIRPIGQNIHPKMLTRERTAGYYQFCVINATVLDIQKTKKRIELGPNYSHLDYYVNYYTVKLKIHNSTPSIPVTQTEKYGPCDNLVNTEKDSVLLLRDYNKAPVRTGQEIKTNIDFRGDEWFHGYLLSNVKILNK